MKEDCLCSVFYVSRLWAVGVWLKLNQITKVKVMGHTWVMSNLSINEPITIRYICLFKTIMDMKLINFVQRLLTYYLSVHKSPLTKVKVK